MSLQSQLWSQTLGGFQSHTYDIFVLSVVIFPLFDIIQLDQVLHKSLKTYNQTIITTTPSDILVLFFIYLDCSSLFVSLLMQLTSLDHQNLAYQACCKCLTVAKGDKL